MPIGSNYTYESTVRRYWCVECGKYYGRKNRLTRHLNCDKTFKKKAYWVLHMALHSTQKPHQCSRSDKTFTRNSDLVLHLVVNHRERPYNCNQCDKKYFKNSHLTRHQRYRAAEVPQFNSSTEHYESGISESNQKCHLCKKSFPSRRVLVAHLRWVHSQWWTVW